MGQRLVITIRRGENVIANAYYHWSAYSQSALALTKSALEKLAEIKSSQTFRASDRMLAYLLLHATGARIGHGNLEELNKQDAEKRDELEYLLAEYQNSKDTLDRNKGLIGLYPDAIKDLQSWSEGDVSIDLEDESIDFGLLSVEEDVEYLKKEYGMTDEDLNNLPILSISLPETFDRDTIEILDAAIEVAAQNEFGMFRAGESEYYQITQ